jgi:hypothetical protein
MDNVDILLFRRFLFDRVSIDLGGVIARKGERGGNG